MCIVQFLIEFAKLEKDELSPAVTDENFFVCQVLLHFPRRVERFVLRRIPQRTSFFCVALRQTAAARTRRGFVRPTTAECLSSVRALGGDCRTTRCGGSRGGKSLQSPLGVSEESSRCAWQTDRRETRERKARDATASKVCADCGETHRRSEQCLI